MLLIWLTLLTYSFVSAHVLARRQTDTIDFSDAEIASGEAQSQLADRAFQNAWEALPDEGECSKKNVQIRTEFRKMSLPERKAYTDAIQCLQNTPSALDSELYPGAKTRYDDFVAVHINQTNFIHANAPFLTWHRYYTWIFHRELIERCDYTGQLAFWEWGIDAASDTPLRDSELFNGDPYSMGTDGVFDPDNTDKVFNLSLLVGNVDGSVTTFEAGSGGGPVSAGPFSDYTVNLGPVLNPYLPPLPSPYDYNPRPLSRSLRDVTLRQYISYANYTPILYNAETPFEFSTLFDNDPRNINIEPVHILWGPHGAGHLIFGGEMGDDLSVSPAEPMFWLHHGQVDRIYWIWQNLKVDQIEYRTTQIANLTRTFYNNPPSDYATVDDLLDLDILAPAIAIKDAMSTTGGSPFCFLYK